MSQDTWLQLEADYGSNELSKTSAVVLFISRPSARENTAVIKMIMIQLEQLTEYWSSTYSSPICRKHKHTHKWWVWLHGRCTHNAGLWVLSIIQGLFNTGHTGWGITQTLQTEFICSFQWSHHSDTYTDSVNARCQCTQEWNISHVCRGRWWLLYIMLMLMELSKEPCRHGRYPWHAYTLYITGPGCACWHNGHEWVCQGGMIHVSPLWWMCVMQVELPHHLTIKDRNRDLTEDLSNIFLAFLLMAKAGPHQVLLTRIGGKLSSSKPISAFLYFTEPSHFKEMHFSSVSKLQLPINVTVGLMDNTLSHWWQTERFERGGAGFMSRALLAKGVAMALL